MHLDDFRELTASFFWCSEEDPVTQYTVEKQTVIIAAVSSTESKLSEYKDHLIVSND